MRLKAVVFDLDGTLGDTLPVVVQAFQETFIRFSGREYSPTEIFAMFGPSEEGIVAALVSPDRYEAALQHFLERYASLHGPADRPFPGTIELLADLRIKGIHVAIVTGKGVGTARISMDALGLEPYIERLVAGSPAGADKPAALRALLADWGLDPGEAAYVGDMPYDMQAAHEVGMFALGAVWATSATVNDNSGADMLFYSVTALRDWLLGQASSTPPGQTPTGQPL